MRFLPSELRPAADHDELRERYALHHGVSAGHLPSSLDGLIEWLERIAQEVAADPPEEHPSVAEFRWLIENDRQVRGLVLQMIEESHGKTRAGTHPIQSPQQMLDILNHILSRPPTLDNAFPISGVFLYMMFTKAGWFGFRNPALNNALRQIVDAYGRFLDSPESLSSVHQGEGGWLSPAGQRKMGLPSFQVDYDDPHGGFASYNAFFHRDIKEGVRPLAGEDQRDVIVSANDGVVFKIARLVQYEAPFWTKDQPYSLRHILGPEWAEEFVDGDVFQSFLSGDNFHRWVAPVAGEVLEATVVPGLMFSELLSVGWDEGGGTKSTAYEASVNTRGIVIIDTHDAGIGKVAVVPIGITEVSSVHHVYRDGSTVQKGDAVHKGQEIGRFSLGGSTLAMIFQPGAIKEFRFDWPPPCPDCPPTISARDWIALANPRPH